MIHLYYGDGAGKTTAAMGLALRMAGRGNGVVIAQFLKGADTGERIALARVPGVECLPVPDRQDFLIHMTQDQREEERRRALALLQRAGARGAEESCGLVVLDEVGDTVDLGLLTEEEVLSVLKEITGEIVLTGHRANRGLAEAAQYITHFEKIRHPYDKGVPARRGVED